MASAGGAPVAIVTGSEGGLGSAIARTLHDAGHRVIGFDMAPAREPRAWETTVCDVGDLEACLAAAADVVAGHGRIDVLVNNAGTSLPLRRIDQIDEESWRAVSRPTLDGAIWMARAVLPHMIAAKRGTVVNLASMAGVVTPASMGAYGVAKAGMIQLSKVIAVENYVHGIRSNAILLGAADTALSDRTRSALAQQAVMPSNGTGTTAKPLDRIQPQQVADIVALLCQPGAREITGAAIAVDQAHHAGLASSLAIGLLPLEV